MNTIELKNLLKPYKNNELLPNHIIDNIINYSFNNYQIVKEYNSYHKIIKVKISDLLSIPIKNWKYNRPPDLIRCDDIARYIYKSKNPLETVIFLSFN